MVFSYYSLISQKSNGAKILVKSFNVLAISGYNNPIKNFIVTSKRIACNYLYTTYCSYLYAENSKDCELP